MKRQEIATLITITLLFLSIILVVPSKSKANITCIVGIETTITNQGNVTYPLYEMNKITLIPETDFQKLISFKYYVNGVEVNWKSLGLNEEGNIEVKIENLPKELPPNKTINFKMILEVEVIKRESPKELSIEMAGSISDIPNEVIEKYCKLEGLWLKSQNASNLAMELANGENNTLKILYKFIKWIENNIKYPQSSEPKVPSYPDETIRLKIGDCDDQANLLVAMLRSIGIPSYTQLAFLYIEKLGFQRKPNLLGGHLTIETVKVAGHGWAMAYIPPWGWLPIDMTFFANARMKLGRIVSVNVEDHIIGAAVYQYASVITENIIKTDYIKDLEEWIEDLNKYNLKWKEKYWMEIEEKPPIRERDSVILISVAGLMTISITATILYIYAKRRRKAIENIFPHNN